jgi:RNA polymerase sigma-70 factor (ECF subfamily)
MFATVFLARLDARNDTRKRTRPPTREQTTPAAGQQMHSDQKYRAFRKLRYQRQRGAALSRAPSFRQFFCRVWLPGAFIMAMIPGARAVWGRMDVIESQSRPSGGLLGRIGDGPAAFVQLYRRNYDDIFRYCVHRLFERHTAEDVTSEVFLKAARHIHRFSGCDEGQFRNWLYRIATNEINGHLRKTSRRERLLRRIRQGPDEPAVIHDDPDAEQVGRVKEAVRRLKPAHQTIITLRFFENLKPTEIAEVLGCSAATARSKLTRAIAQLRKKLKAVGAEPPAGGEPDE